MSTLSEIEAAVAGLPVEQQKVLYAHLSERLQVRPSNDATASNDSPAPSRREFPISRGRAAFGAEAIAQIEAEADAGE
jgi:hypothetical protein